MNTEAFSSSSMKSLMLTVAGLLSVILAFAVAREHGTLDPDLARRLVAIEFGVMLLVIGNALRKIVRPLRMHGNDPPRFMAADRFAGRNLVLAGICSSHCGYSRRSNTSCAFRRSLVSPRSGSWPPVSYGCRSAAIADAVMRRRTPHPRMPSRTRVGCSSTSSMHSCGCSQCFWLIPSGGPGGAVDEHRLRVVDRSGPGAGAVRASTPELSYDDRRPQCHLHVCVGHQRARRHRGIVRRPGQARARSRRCR